MHINQLTSVERIYTAYQSTPCMHHGRRENDAYMKYIKAYRYWLRPSHEIPSKLHTFNGEVSYTLILHNIAIGMVKTTSEHNVIIIIKTSCKCDISR